MADDIQDSTSEGTEKTLTENSDATQETPSSQQGKSEDSQKFTAAQQALVDRLLAKAKRDERAKLEKQVNEAQLSELERAKSDLAKATLELRRRDTEATLLQAIKNQGGDDPEVIAGWIQSKLEMEFDENGKLTNLKELMQETKERIPTRFPKRPGSANGGDGKASGLAQNMNDLIRRAAGRIP